MTAPSPIIADPQLDLVLDRLLDAPRDLVWEAWTTPRHVEKWFCPHPWSVTDCQIDLRPGGIFAFTMHSPEGDAFPNAGCFLDVVPLERLIWTDALLPGYRPAPEPFFTAAVTFADEAGGTRYIATAIHRDEAGRAKHEQMGFHDGWGTVADQLVAYVKTM